MGLANSTLAVYCPPEVDAKVFMPMAFEYLGKAREKARRPFFTPTFRSPTKAH